MTVKFYYSIIYKYLGGGGGGGGGRDSLMLEAEVLYPSRTCVIVPKIVVSSLCDWTSWGLITMIPCSCPFYIMCWTCSCPFYIMCCNKSTYANELHKVLFVYLFRAVRDQHACWYTVDGNTSVTSAVSFNNKEQVDVTRWAEHADFISSLQTLTMR